MKRSVMKRWIAPLVLRAALFGCALWASPSRQETGKTIRVIDPPEQDFFSKAIDYRGIPIKAHREVSDEALVAAYDRLATELEHLPAVAANLAAAGGELHIIGRNQVTTDLPEWRHDKHVPLDEYNGLTRDQRTRGMGGLITSCGEENLLRLAGDRYRGRDICIHEFAHNIQGRGIPGSLRARFDEQYRKSLEKGLWLNSYAGSNPNEYFAELTMWYFGTRGDLGMSGPKPENGPEGLRKYDPEAFALLDDFYSGQIEVEARTPGPRTTANGPAQRTPRDSMAARAIVARLMSYRPGETTLIQFLSDAGMPSASDNGINGWHVTRLSGRGDTFRVEYDSRGSAGRNGRAFSASLADLEFKARILASLSWNN
jgi:alpha-glucosidase